MKKLFLGIAAVSMLAMTSCKEEESTNTVNYPVTTYNLVVDNESGSAASVVASTYKFNYDLNSRKVTISTELAMSSLSSTSFITNSISYDGGVFTLYEKFSDLLNYSGEIINVKSDNAGSTGSQLAIRNLDCQLTTFVYVPESIQGIKDVSFPYGYEYALMSYDLGDKYSVRTFWPDATFKGVTNTQYPYKGENKTFSNEDMLYRVMLDLEKKTATVVMYNAKFAQEMPNALSNIVLENLPVTIDAQGYSISATNIEPKVYGSGVATPYPNFTFDKFEMSTVGDLTETTISYTVAGTYKGSFSGSYCVKIKTDD